MTDWQDISTAPRDGTVVDLWVVSEETGKGYRRTDCSFDGEYWVTPEYAIAVYPPHFKATHFMIVPAPVLESE